VSSSEAPLSNKKLPNFLHDERLFATGNMETLRMLAGFTYQGARGVKQDLKRAAEMYQTAADGGDRIAMAELGRMYFFGIGAPKDVKRAMNLF
jgi:TPR repeat protein